MSQIEDEYFTFAVSSIGEYKDKGSKFIAYGYPASSVSEVEQQLQVIRTEHPKARHVCYAYALGIERNQKRANDDGEPSGTAGKPIYNRILSHELTDCHIAVVRYFGGTKLGTTGLIRAYKESAEDAIANNRIVKKYLFHQYLFKFDYAIMGDLLNHIKQLDISILEKNLDANPNLIVGIRQSKSQELLFHLKAKMLSISVDRINDKTEVAGLNISLC